MVRGREWGEGYNDMDQQEGAQAGLSFVPMSYSEVPYSAIRCNAAGCRGQGWRRLAARGCGNAVGRTGFGVMGLHVVAISVMWDAGAGDMVGGVDVIRGLGGPGVVVVVCVMHARVASIRVFKGVGHWWE